MTEKEKTAVSVNAESSLSQMTAEERFRIVTSVGEECIQEEDQLFNLLSTKPQPISYDGFEPSARMHIALGIMKTINVNKLTHAGCKVKLWIADLFAMINNKVGGDLKKIQTIGHYFIEIWKAVGMDLDGDKVEFLWCSEEINARASEYWPLVLDIATKNTVRRITRCAQIMGSNEQDELTAAQIFYPCMQCADVFFLKADICQMGMDQREVNVLAREYCDDIKRKNKPIILSHHMLPGLQQGQAKMSKSDPSSAIFMDDEEAEVNRKIKKAYCPPNVIEGNPCLDYVKFIIFPWFNEFKVERRQKDGGDRIFTSFEELVVEYESGQLHPADLKPALSKALNKILQPVRDHFKNDANAKDLLKRVRHIVSRLSKEEQTPQAESMQSLSVNAEPNSTPASSPSTSSQMTAEERFRIVRSVGEECIEEGELLNLLSKKPQPICYDGFEPSGRMHIAQGAMKTINVNKLTGAGCKVKIWIADWFAQLNNKVGGDLEKIQTVGHYLIEIWKAVGMDLDGDKVEFLWSSKEINARALEYWPLLVLDIARKNNVRRIMRCGQIMGRNEQD
ncbi:Tyrosine--tRNA ligase 2 cytoplasmic [Euphorbia peplus]|nr:Tyrosine--tRNA ligase 2 cytoplasmic [Euphorbia peplus]